MFCASHLWSGAGFSYSCVPILWFTFFGNSFRAAHHAQLSIMPSPSSPQCSYCLIPGWRKKNRLIHVWQSESKVSFWDAHYSSFSLANAFHQMPVSPNLFSYLVGLFLQLFKRYISSASVCFWHKSLSLANGSSNQVHWCLIDLRTGDNKTAFLVIFLIL